MVAVAVTFAPPRASAEDAPDLTQVYSMVRSLQERVASLEVENRQAKREAAEARSEARKLSLKLAATSPSAAATTAPARVPTPPTGPLQAYAMVPSAPPPPSWVGLYGGAAFGAGWLRSQVDARGTLVSNQSQTGIGFTSTQSEVDTLVGTESGRNIGAIANLFLGYNAVLTDNFIIGGQVEGGVSNIRANLSGSSTTVTNRVIVTSFGGPPTINNVTQVSQSSLSDPLDNRWLVSALARAGWLVDSLDYAYLLGGYTYGRFDFGKSFGLNGATVGAGWERQVASGWTVKAEGRYTKFQSKDVTSSVTQSFTETVGTSTQTGTATLATTSRVSVDMWSIGFGIARYFN